MHPVNPIIFVIDKVDICRVVEGMGRCFDFQPSGSYFVITGASLFILMMAVAFAVVFVMVVPMLMAATAAVIVIVMVVLVLMAATAHLSAMARCLPRTHGPHGV